MNAIELSYFYDILEAIFGAGVLYITFVIVYLTLGVPIMTEVIERWEDLEYHEAEKIAVKIYKKTLKPVIVSAIIILFLLIFFPSERTLDIMIGKKLIHEYGNSPIIVDMYHKIVEDQK